MFREQLPRVYELRDLITRPTAPDAYFQYFDDSLRDEPSKMKVWCARERELQRLDANAWRFLKDEALPYPTKKGPERRGWEQLIAMLNQARAYISKMTPIQRVNADAQAAGLGPLLVCRLRASRSALWHRRTLRR